MECKDLNKKFEDIDGWIKADDVKKHIQNTSNFLISNKPFLL